MELNKLQRTAVEYINAGRSIIPTNLKDKRPVIPVWKPFQKNVPIADQVIFWFQKHKALAILAGKVSGNVELMDFDSDPERPDTFNKWRGLVEEEDPELFKKLVIQTTQNNGFHCAYCCPGVQIPGNQKLAQFKNGSNVKAIIETRGEGGYFLADPSPGYKLKQGTFTEIPEISASEREVLLRCAKLLNEHVTPARGQNRSPGRQDRDSLTPGNDLNERSDIRAFLEAKGWTHIETRGEIERWRRPGKDRGSSASLLDGKTLYNFSSNAYPLEAEQSYDLFGLYTMYDHEGDFTAAAKDLARQGYGEQIPKQAEAEDLEFPAWIMTGAAGEFSQLYSSCLESPTEFFYFSFLTCLGNVLAKRLTLESQVAPQPRFFTVLLGESADDRKSTAAKETVNFFRQTLEEDFNVCYGVGSAEGLQARINESDSLILFLDEFKAFVSKCKIDASVLLPCVNTLFESNRYESRTQRTDIKLTSAYLSILAASTVDTYANTWSSQFTDIGFNNRLWLVPGSGERKFSIPPKVPDRDTYIIKQKLGEILRHVGEGAELPIAKEAQTLFHLWYMGLEGSIHTKRLDTYALRLMPLLAANELKDEIDIGITEKVIALAEWQLQVRRIHDPIDAENNIAKMEERIRRLLSSRGALDSRELKQRTNASRAGLWVWNQSLKNLLGAREVVYHQKDKVYYVPKVAK